MLISKHASVKQLTTHFEIRVFISGDQQAVVPPQAP